MAVLHRRIAQHIRAQTCLQSGDLDEPVVSGGRVVVEAFTIPQAVNEGVPAT